ncbi:hypothetical protein [Streptomyces sp. NPDC091371]|uniref:hypothetical protein n=1 Tax=Streptomyces sp. NPDC091371 TaxID=3155303 RepID=UPI00341646AC
MSMNDLNHGSRRYRIAVHWAYAVTTGFGGIVAFITSVAGTVAGVGAFSGADTVRDHVTGLLAMYWLTALCLDLAQKMTRDALALHRAARPEDADVTGGHLLTLCFTYGAVAGIVLSVNATGVPLWGVLLIMCGPPLPVLAFKAREVLRKRTAARAAVRAAARPVVSTRNPRATRRTSRAQRRGSS